VGGPRLAYAERLGSATDGCVTQHDQQQRAVALREQRLDGIEFAAAASELPHGGLWPCCPLSKELLSFRDKIDRGA
jgi:hypothetical protein